MLLSLVVLLCGAEFFLLILLLVLSSSSSGWCCGPSSLFVESAPLGGLTFQYPSLVWSFPSSLMLVSRHSFLLGILFSLRCPCGSCCLLPPPVAWCCLSPPHWGGDVLSFSLVGGAPFPFLFLLCGVVVLHVLDVVLPFFFLICL